MDANQRKRKAPPLPKFQQQNNKNSKVVEKVTDFLHQISKETNVHQNTQKQAVAPSPAPEGEKKKFNLSSINSKLNSIMNAKKIDLNKVVQSSKKTVQSHQTKSRRDIQIQYDPAHPNSYEQSKSHYIETFQNLRNSKPQNKQDDTDDRISKMIAQFQKIGQQIDEQINYEISEQVDNNKLDDRESLALRMMQKFGFKVGDGLGKQSQGIKTPLTIKKLTDSSCKIQPSSLSLANFITLQQSANNALLAFKIQKSQVLALKIAMKLNELTEQVELQIKEQCSKYGQIVEWIAYSTNETIIFFCLYEKIQQSFRAFTKINGRYYDQRIINVFFYPKRLFQQKNFNQPFHQVVQF